MPREFKPIDREVEAEKRPLNGKPLKKVSATVFNWIPIGKSSKEQGPLPVALKIQHEELPGLNLTPMIDVVFLLIIFFMVGSKFGDMERSIDLDVPQVGAASTMITPPQKRVINLFQDGRLLLDNAPVTLPQLTDSLRRAHQQYADVGVLVRGDANSSLQNVAGVLSACREAGLSEMGIAVRMGSTEIR